MPPYRDLTDEALGFVQHPESESGEESGKFLKGRRLTDVNGVPAFGKHADHFGCEPAGREFGNVHALVELGIHRGGSTSTTRMAVPFSW